MQSASESQWQKAFICSYFWGLFDIAGKAPLDMR